MKQMTGQVEIFACPHFLSAVQAFMAWPSPGTSLKEIDCNTILINFSFSTPKSMYSPPLSDTDYTILNVLNLIAIKSIKIG